MTKLNVLVIICVLTGAFILQVECQPPSLQIEQSSSACHGPYSDKTTVHATCNNGQVIAINSITLGSKLESTGCPLNYNESYGFATCCTNDQINDCTFSLYYENYNYHRRCNGYQTCKALTSIQQTPLSCTSGYFTTLSRYMFMEYFCIDVADDKMVKLCSATKSTITRENTTVYVWNTDFGVSSISPSYPRCNCSVEIDNCDAYIDIYKMYRILTGNGNGACNQTIRIGSGEDSTVLYDWDCSDNKQDIENFQAKVTYILLNLENTRNDTDGMVWMGFQATQNSNITVSCPPTTQQYCMQTTTSTTMNVTTVTISTTTENMTTTTTTEPSISTTTTTEIEDKTRFNISCVSRDIGTTIQISTANNTRGSEATVKVPIYAIMIPSVICAMLLVIILCLLVYIRRPRRQNQTNQLSDELPHTLQLSEVDTGADNDKVNRNDGKAAIESFNSYERLKIYENQNCIDEVYEQLDIDKV